MTSEQTTQAVTVSAAKFKALKEKLVKSERAAIKDAQERCRNALADLNAEYKEDKNKLAYEKRDLLADIAKQYAAKRQQLNEARKATRIALRNKMLESLTPEERAERERMREAMAKHRAKVRAEREKAKAAEADAVQAEEDDTPTRKVVW